MSRPTKDNPTGVESFNHSSLAKFPEYQAACLALNSLVLAIDGQSDQKQWLKTVEQMAASLGYADCCSQCRPARDWTLYWPFATEVKDGWLRGAYRCVHGHTWTCGYAVDISDLP